MRKKNYEIINNFLILEKDRLHDELQCQEEKVNDDYGELVAVNTKHEQKVINNMTK